MGCGICFGYAYAFCLPIKNSWRRPSAASTTVGRAPSVDPIILHGEAASIAIPKHVTNQTHTRSRRCVLNFEKKGFDWVWVCVFCPTGYGVIEIVGMGNLKLNLPTQPPRSAMSESSVTWGSGTTCPNPNTNVKIMPARLRTAIRKK